MKAHIPMTSRQRTSVNRDIQILAKKQMETERVDFTRKLFKLAVVVLNDEFGFGTMRNAKFIEKLSDLIKTSTEDIIFWEHIDRQVIDRLGLPFERDYTR